MEKLVDVLHMPWSDFAEKTKDSAIAIAPIGATEVYGPHLPLGTDGIAARAVAKEVARKSDMNILVGPLIPVGFSRSLQTFPGTMSVSTSSLTSYLKDYALSLAKWHCQNIVFFNGHLSNVPGVSELMYELWDEEGVRSFQIDLWRFIQPFSKDLLDSEHSKFGHAAEAMTSVMLYLKPELVQMNKAVDKSTREEPSPPGVHKMLNYRSKSNQGVVGFSKIANKDKGKKIVTRTVEELKEIIKSTFESDYPDFQ